MLKEEQKVINVEFKVKIDNDINCFRVIPEDMKNIIIYCHNLGSDSSWALRFYKELCNHQIGIIAPDFPSHGLDNTDFKKFNLNLCLLYLDTVIKYVKRIYPDVKINLLGSSFGSYIILNRLIRNIEHFNTVLLMCPYVDLESIFKEQHNLTQEYYQNHEYKFLYGKVKLYYNTYLDFITNKVLNNSKIIRNNNIYVIYGTDDKVISLEMIESFCYNLNIPLTKVKGAPHEFYSYLNEVNKFIIDKVNNH